MDSTIIIIIAIVICVICLSLSVSSSIFLNRSSEKEPQPLPDASNLKIPETSSNKSIINANPGDAISCLNYNPKGDGAIYRYDGDRKMRWYPNPEIAGSWDPNWGSGGNRKIDCTGFQLGEDIAKQVSFGQPAPAQPVLIGQPTLFGRPST